MFQIKLFADDRLMNGYLELLVRYISVITISAISYGTDDAGNNRLYFMVVLQTDKPIDWLDEEYERLVK